MLKLNQDYKNKSSLYQTYPPLIQIIINGSLMPEIPKKYLFDTLSQIEQKASSLNNFSQIQEQLLAEVNKNNLRLDKIIQTLKFFMKGSKNTKSSITPEKLQPKRLKQRVDKAIYSTKYLK